MRAHVYSHGHECTHLCVLFHSISLSPVTSPEITFEFYPDLPDSISLLPPWNWPVVCYNFPRESPVSVPLPILTFVCPLAPLPLLQPCSCASPHSCPPTAAPSLPPCSCPSTPAPAHPCRFLDRFPCLFLSAPLSIPMSLYPRSSSYPFVLTPGTLCLYPCLYTCPFATAPDPLPPGLAFNPCSRLCSSPSSSISSLKSARLHSSLFPFQSSQWYILCYFIQVL